MRVDRKQDELRSIKITRNYLEYPDGSVLVEFGKTKVLCNVSCTTKIPKFLQGKSQGWLTAEYAMLPSSTATRNERASIKPNKRSIEIQRLIGRSLRAMIDLNKIPGINITIDCDVIQADGGTRVSSITGAAIALVDAINSLMGKNLIKENPIKSLICAISVGILNKEAYLDLEYSEDSVADTDMNLVFCEDLSFVEIQGCAEGESFSYEELQKMIELGKKGAKEIFEIQKRALEA
ncbi:MAG: ribonuclease PH [Psittacicella sp.]